MNKETQVVVEIWEATRDFIPLARRVEIATVLLRSFEEFGIDPGDLQDLKGEDKHLQEAYDSLYGDDDELEYEEDEENDDGYEN